MSCLFLSKVTLQSCLFFLVKGNSSELLPLLRQPLPCVFFVCSDMEIEEELASNY